jgi:hypothetical protein
MRVYDVVRVDVATYHAGAYNGRQDAGQLVRDTTSRVNTGPE